MRRSFLLVFVAAALGSVASAEDQPRSVAPSSAISPSQHAEALVEQLRRGDAPVRDDAVRGLLALASAEDEKLAGERPVHEVLRRALLDGDAEVRFRVRRILADPEVRVERLLVALLEPQQTEEVRRLERALLGRQDRAAARAGLLRVARKAAEAGFDPLTSKLNETWHSWGIEGGAKLRQGRRFHIAVDLLGEMTSDEEVAPLCQLLDEDLGDSLTDLIEALAARPVAARQCLRTALASPCAIVRENAAWALGEIGTAEDVPALDNALGDPDPRVRRAAVSAFETLPVDAAACIPAAGHANDGDFAVATAALHLGATFGHRFVGDPARRLLLSEAPLETRVQAVRALARVGDGAGTLRGLADKGGDAAKFAAWGSGMSRDAEALGTLEQLLGRDEFMTEPGVYYGIARAGAVTWLDRLARSANNDARRCAILALGSAKGDATQIAQALQDAATRAVEHESGSDWVDFVDVCIALRDRNDDAARKAIGVLLDQALVNATRGSGIEDHNLGRVIELAHQLRSKQCVRGFVTILRSRQNPYLRGLAMDALATVDPQRAREVLTPMLDYPNMTPDMIQALSRSLSRAGERARSQRAVEIAKQKVAYAVAPNEQSHFSEALNTEGIEHAYAAEPSEAVFCFRRMRWLRPDDNIASYNIACALALAGDKDNALRWLRRSIREGFKNWRHIERDADLTALYDEPRFKRIIDDLRLEQEVDPAVDR